MEMSGDMPPELLENNAEHAYFMKQALMMGEKALATGETPVGCVLVYDNKIVGSGMNDTNKSMNVDPPYPVQGGLFHKEAIMLLRRFYIQENEKAPKPRPKKHRELKTDFDQEVLIASPTP
ncbi:cytidine and deoxycytidylate deaminase zinc-binding domain protein [Aspergillus niger]|uniref:Cytidine and deoxycytidylate deaminase zinc-binding domain protein n=1 Tax=Aspergillus niger TaxID=5061 RepID=A0A100IKW9_ASPNG|nr:cytidine and deoxycytidylate deaminase zinc-binding domain protein [Aspergillus niger]